MDTSGWVFMFANFSSADFSQKKSRNTIRVTNGLVLGQDGHFVGPDLVPNRFNVYQQKTKIVTSCTVVVKELNF